MRPQRIGLSRSLSIMAGEYAVEMIFKQTLALFAIHGVSGLLSFSRVAFSRLRASCSLPRSVLSDRPNSS